MASKPISSLIVLVDIERLSERPDVVQAELRRSMNEMVRSALSDTGLRWEDCHHKDRDDGMLLLLPQASPVDLLGGFVRELDGELRVHRRSHTPLYAMRLRVAIHHGFVLRDPDGWVGSAIQTAAWLVGADAARRALQDLPDAHLVVVIGDELHEAVVMQGHPAIDDRAFREVLLDATKPEIRAWIAVVGPAASGASTAAGPSEQTEPAAPRRPTERNRPSGRPEHVGNLFEGPVTVQRDVIGQQYNDGRRPR